MGRHRQVDSAQDLEIAERLVNVLEPDCLLARRGRAAKLGPAKLGPARLGPAELGPAKARGDVGLAHRTVPLPASRRLTSRAIRRSVNRASGIVRQRNKSAATV